LSCGSCSSKANSRGGSKWEDRRSRFSRHPSRRQRRPDLHAHGYGLDDKSVTKAAVDKGIWLDCPHGCGYRGARESVNNHVDRYHREK
jgi:hypothetical protein